MPLGNVILTPTTLTPNVFLMTMERSPVSSPMILMVPTLSFPEVSGTASAKTRVGSDNIVRNPSHWTAVESTHVYIFPSFIQDRHRGIRRPFNLLVQRDAIGSRALVAHPEVPDESIRAGT